MAGKKTTDADDDPFPRDKEEFFKVAWEDLERKVTRQDAWEITYFFASVTRKGDVLADLDFEIFIDKMLEILQHPEDDEKNLRIPAPETPTWEWLERLFLGAMQMSVSEMK